MKNPVNLMKSQIKWKVCMFINIFIHSKTIIESLLSSEHSQDKILWPPDTAFSWEGGDEQTKYIVQCLGY